MVGRQNDRLISYISAPAFSSAQTVIDVFLKRGYAALHKSLSARLTEWILILSVGCWFVGCGTHNPLSLVNVTETSTTIPYEKAEYVCALLAMPGDILLLHVGDSAMEKAILQLGVYPATLVDILDFNDPITKYLHTEIIYKIDTREGIKTKGFYPLVKKYTGNQFRNNYTIYQVRGPVSKQERALDKMSNQEYPQLGFCGDYVAWAYDNGIYSWWNRVPYLRDILVFVYPPEAIQTADNLANSPETVKICEVVDGELVYPEAIDTKGLVRFLERNLKSENNAISNHARFALERLKAHHVLDQSGRILSESITFLKD
jgi:hypothetical protein